jgi:uncharacterized protein
LPALIEKIVAFGHPNISALHPTTLMFTKDTNVSKNGDCIVGVSADKAVLAFGNGFKEKLKASTTKVAILIEVDSLKWQINALGSPKLTLTDSKEIVIRKSDFASERTMAVCADQSSLDMPREMVERLKNPNQQINVTFTVEA